MVHPKILTYLYTIGGNFNDYVLPILFQKKATHMFPSGGITDKGQFKLEFFNVKFPFRIKRNNENDLFWNRVLNCVVKDIREKWILRYISGFSGLLLFLLLVLICFDLFFVVFCSLFFVFCSLFFVFPCFLLLLFVCFLLFVFVCFLLFDFVCFMLFFFVSFCLFFVLCFCLFFVVCLCLFVFVCLFFLLVFVCFLLFAFVFFFLVCLFGVL